MKRNFVRAGMLILCMVTLVLAACNQPVASNSTTGSLRIRLANNINTQTLVPAIDMTAASYAVNSTGPGGATFTGTSTGGDVVENGLAFGTWNVIVSAKNSVGTTIGTGAASAQVNTGETASVTVAVTPLSGNGTLSLTISWPASQVQTPSISATLAPTVTGGTPQNLPFTISGSSATYSGTAGNGYYVLAFTLSDNGLAVAGTADIVRIVAGQTTSGTYSFSNVNAPGGSLTVTISPNLQDPLQVTMGGQPTQTHGTTQTLTAIVLNYTGSISYRWYVNGVFQGTTDSVFVFGSGVGVGYYIIDVAAFTADGTQAGSATLSVQVTN